jgi:hypothetical protein
MSSKETAMTHAQIEIAELKARELERRAARYAIHNGFTTRHCHEATDDFRTPDAIRNTCNVCGGDRRLPL